MTLTTRRARWRSTPNSDPKQIESYSIIRIYVILMLFLKYYNLRLRIFIIFSDCIYTEPFVISELYTLLLPVFIYVPPGNHEHTSLPLPLKTLLWYIYVKGNTTTMRSWYFFFKYSPCAETMIYGRFTKNPLSCYYELQLSVMSLNVPCCIL